MPNLIGRLVATLTLDKSKFDSGLRQTTARMRNSADQLTRVGRDLSFAFTGPLAIALGASARFATGFEAELTKLETQIGTSRRDVELLKDSVLGLAGETGRGPEELARALFAVQSAGKKGAESLDILERSAKASAIGLGDTRTIALAVTSAMTAFSAQNLTAARATEVLLATVREGNLEAETLAGSLGRVIGIAAQAGVSFEQTGAFIAGFTRVGVSAEEAVTSLRGVLASIIKPQEDTRKALAEIGLTVDEVRAKIANDGLAQTLVFLVRAFDGNIEALGRLIPNVRALSGFLANASSQQEEFLRITQNVTGELNNLDPAFARVRETSAQALSELKVGAEILAITIGAELLPALNSTAKALTGFLKELRNTDPALLRLGIVSAAALAALGPLAIAIGVMTKALLGLAGALAGLLRVSAVAFFFVLLNPVLLIAGALVAAKLALDDYGTSLRRIPIIGAPIADFFDDLRIKVLEVQRSIVQSLQNVVAAFLETARALAAHPFVPDVVVDPFIQSIQAAESALEKLGKDIDKARETEEIKKRLRADIQIDPVLETGEFGPRIGEILRAELEGSLDTALPEGAFGPFLSQKLRKELEGAAKAAGSTPIDIPVVPNPVIIDTKIVDAQKSLSEALNGLAQDVELQQFSDPIERETRRIIRTFQEMAIQAGVSTDEIARVVRELRRPFAEAGRLARKLETELNIGQALADLQGQVDDLDIADPFERETARIIRSVVEMAATTGENVDDVISKIRELRAVLDQAEEQQRRTVTVDLGASVSGGIREIATGILRGTASVESAAQVIRDILINTLAQAFADIIAKKLLFDAKFTLNFRELGKEAGEAVDSEAMASPFRMAFDSIVNALSSAKDAVFGVLSDLASGIGDVLRSAVSAIDLTGLIDPIREAFSEFLVGGLLSARDKIVEIGSQIGSALSEALSGALENFSPSALVDSFGDAFAQIFELGGRTLRNLVKLAVDAAVAIGNILMRAFSTQSAASAGATAVTGAAGFLAGLPIFDSGGIVQEPTVGLLAQNRRPEAVIPLDRLGKLGGSEVNVEINISTPAGTESSVKQSQRGRTRVFDIMVSEALQRQAATNGPGFRAFAGAIGADRRPTGA